MTTGERIKRRRNELDLSVETIADLLGKNRATIYRYESDEIENLPTTVLEPLAKILKTTPAELMGWNDEISFNQEIHEKWGFEGYLKSIGWTYEHISFTDGLNCDKCQERRFASWSGHQTTKDKYPDGNFEPFCEHCKIKDSYYTLTNSSVSFNVSTDDFDNLIKACKLHLLDQLQQLFQKSTNNLFNENKE
ncbi:MAG: helix-turn-helix domain-containing protein [Lachnotalea sp.]